jgi:hypothetical protein
MTDTNAVQSLLENLDLKIVLDSPDNSYRFEYYTTAIKDRKTGQQRLTRTYRLLDLIRSGVTTEPWDTYDLDKQTTLVTNLVNFSNYRMVKIVSGWEFICPVCGHCMSGKIWESIPKACQGISPIKCRTKVDSASINEILYTAI